MGLAQGERGEAAQQQLVLQILGQPLLRVLGAVHWPQLQAQGGLLAEEKAKRIMNYMEIFSIPDMFPCKCINVDIINHRFAF